MSGSERLPDVDGVRDAWTVAASLGEPSVVHGLMEPEFSVHEAVAQDPIFPDGLKDAAVVSTCLDDGRLDGLVHQVDVA